jgi:hypothetical protein
MAQAKERNRQAPNGGLPSSSEDDICSLCMGPIEQDGVILYFNHKFYNLCFLEYIRSNWNTPPGMSGYLTHGGGLEVGLKCPNYRDQVRTDLVEYINIYDIVKVEVFQKEIWPQLFVAFRSRRQTWDDFRLLLEANSFVAPHYNFIFFQEELPEANRDILRPRLIHPPAPFRPLLDLWLPWQHYLLSYYDDPMQNEQIELLLQMLRPYRPEDDAISEQYF